MAAAAPSPLASSVEKTNGAKLSRLLIDGGTSVLRKVFDGYHPPAKLAAHLNACYSVLYNLYYIKVLNNDQWNKLFPPGGVAPDSNTFDITLLFILLTNICGLSRPRWWWNTNPHPSDISPEANLARIKFYRNTLYGHITTTGIDTPTFSRLWKEISAPLVALGLHQTEIDRLKAERSGEEKCLQALRDWADSEENIKSQLQKVSQTQTKTQQTVEQVHQTQTKTQQAVEDVRQSQTKTQQSVEDVRQVQSATQQTVEKVHESQTKTQQTVEEVHQTLTKTQRAVEDVRQSQTKTQQAVEEGRQTQTKTQQTVEQVHQTQTKTQQAVEDVRQSQTKTQQTVEDVRQVQITTQQAVEKVHESQTKTQQTVEEVHQTLTKTQRAVEERREALQDGNLKLKELRQTQTITQQAVEDVRRTQIKDHKALQDSYSKLEEVCQSQIKTQQAVDEVHQMQLEDHRTLQDCTSKMVKLSCSLKEGRDKNSADEVLRNLAKSEFKVDIDYYVERFQVGTREWVFNRVQDWLDDRTCQNRVMVISGNAGMGKSVIAAVICKRMQEASRLSGSHFCQHNNVRYRNPQLMLQSLACHLSHALPEYKHALVEQLSRNLGTELNSVGVEELFALLFKEPLSSINDPGRNMLMVIDGLDESEYQGRNELLDVIANQFCKLPPWIRFVVTTRPATNITEKLKHLQPLQLESNDERNVEDIRAVLHKRLQHVIKPENGNALVEKLLMKSEGLMLYAYFFILYIEENPFLLDQEDLGDSFPLGISSVYHTYFKRLEGELLKELDVKEERYLNLLSAITASREPLPVGFVSKVLVPESNSPLSRRKVLKAINSVSSLLPICDNCLHVIHKSVKDWLTDVSCYGQHEFIMDEKEGHVILAELCSNELDNLKQRSVSVHDTQFSATEKYALHHGARHVFYSHEESEPPRLEELRKAYIVDLEVMFAKLCLNCATAAEDLVWLQKDGILTVFSQSIQSFVNTLLFLLRKHHHIFTTHPRVFLQTVLNEGDAMLSAEASNLLQNKYPEISYMEYMHKETQRGDVIARFQCSSEVACLDVSPNLDYMVCECSNGMLNLWSLQTGRLLWERPVKVTKSFFEHKGAYRIVLKPFVCSRYRSVAFHPTQDIVLPGSLSHAYTVDGDLKPLFPESNCRFSVCSISGDKTRILTDCPKDAKCLVMWSLKNGSEIARINRSDAVLTFAWSRNGRLIAISHSTGSICLVDVTNGFRTLAQTATPEVCGMVTFSPDHRFLLCSRVSFDSAMCCYIVSVTENHHNFSLDVSSAKRFFAPRENHSMLYFCDCGFTLGDPIPARNYISLADELSTLCFFVLKKQTLLRISARKKDIRMLNTSEERTEGQRTGVRTKQISFSWDGQILYLVNIAHTSAVKCNSNEMIPTVLEIIMALDVSSGELLAEKKTGIAVNSCLVPVKEGVLLTASSGTLELWNFDLSRCVRRFGNFSSRTDFIPISQDRVACVTQKDKVSVLDTTNAEIVSTVPLLQRRFIACNSKCQILTSDGYGSLQLSDGTTPLWMDSADSYPFLFNAEFSPDEQYVVILEGFPMVNVKVLDAVSGNKLCNLWSDSRVDGCKFVSDEECVVAYTKSLRLFNVKSGDMLSVIDVEGMAVRFTACLSKCLIAVGHRDSPPPGFKVIRVWLPGDKRSRKNKR